MEVTAVEVAGKSDTYAWKKVSEDDSFLRVTLFPETDSASVSPSEIEEAVHAELDRIQPDAVAVPGWSYPGALTALRWCGQRRTPAVTMAASARRDFTRRWWKEQVKKRVVRHFSAGLVGGARHEAYLQELGISADRVFLGYDVVDNNHFCEGAQRARAEEDARREQFSLPDRYFLSVSRFVPKKNLPRLIMAYARYRRRAPNPPWDLVLVGEGPERSSIEREIREGIQEHVHLPGFKPYEELPIYYGLADAFVHASTREQWGLVVNEAMAAGLPVLVSEQCGCAPDLVVEGSNGYTFDPDGVSELARLLRRVAHSDTDRKQMGRASQRIIDRHGPDRFAVGLKRAVETALEGGAPPDSALDRLLMKALIYR